MNKSCGKALTIKKNFLEKLSYRFFHITTHYFAQKFRFNHFLKTTWNFISLNSPYYLDHKERIRKVEKIYK
jgi:hypothetical protein